MKKNMTIEEASRLLVESIKSAMRAQQQEAPAQPRLKVEPIIGDEETGEAVGVIIPVINKTLIFADVPAEEMKWDEAMAYAEGIGKALPTKQELYIIAYYRDEIAEYWPRINDIALWSASQYSSYHAWCLNYYGILYYRFKYYGFTVVPLADLRP